MPTGTLSINCCQPYDQVISDLAKKLVKNPEPSINKDTERRLYMEDTLRVMIHAVDGIKKLAAQVDTLLVEVSGGLVQDVKALGGVTNPIRVLVRDYDNLKVDPQAEDAEWLLGGEKDMGQDPTGHFLLGLDDNRLTRLAATVADELESRGLRNVSYVDGYKAGFIAALRDENYGPGQVWLDEEAAELFKELDGRFIA